jgi:hypothetical protein
MIAVPDGPASLPPLTAARMAARYAELEDRGNQGVVGRMDNARKIFQREEQRCLTTGKMAELDGLRRSQFVHNPARRSAGAGTAYAAGWGFYCRDGGRHIYPPAVLATPLATPHSTRPSTPQQQPRTPQQRAMPPPTAPPAPPPRTADATTTPQSRPRTTTSALPPTRPEALPAAGSTPTRRLATPAPRSATGASTAPFANAYNTPAAMKTPQSGGSSVSAVRHSAARTIAREGGARHVKEMASDLGGLAVPGGRWGWAGPELHTRAMWGSHAAQAPARAWNSWQTAERDGSLLLS